MSNDQCSKPRIIIEMSGGFVHIVHSDVEIDYDILDWDEKGESPEIDRDLEALNAEAQRMPHGY